MAENPRNPTPSTMTGSEVSAAVGAPWRVVDDELQATYRTRTMVIGGRFVAAIIEAAEQANHHPDIDLRYGTVHLVLSTHSVGGLTEADVALADAISGIAAGMDVPAADEADG